MTAEAQVTATPLLSVRGLRTRYPVRGGLVTRAKAWITAVDGVGFDLCAGRTLGIVGESGCGKTTLGRSILRLVEPLDGQILFDGMNVRTLSRRELRRFRRRAQMIFQDPVGSLNPRMSVGETIGEGMVIHRLARGAHVRDRVAELMQRVGLGAELMDRYPHALSSGQKQRVGIARALALQPDMVVCDEPVSALDASIQSQILNLLSDLQRTMGMAYLFISHNLGVVHHISDETAVMYLGRIVETGPTYSMIGEARHPYTLSLISAVRDIDSPPRPPIRLTGEPPSPLEPPSGCAFHPRCPLADERCRREAPPLETKPDLAADHLVACHRSGEEISNRLSNLPFAAPRSL